MFCDSLCFYISSFFVTFYLIWDDVFRAGGSSSLRTSTSVGDQLRTPIATIHQDFAKLMVGQAVDIKRLALIFKSCLQMLCRLGLKKQELAGHECRESSSLS